MVAAGMNPAAKVTLVRNSEREYAEAVPVHEFGGLRR